MEELKEFRDKINQLLKEFFLEQKSSYKSLSKYNRSGLKVIEEFTLRGGKRVRASLLYHTYLMFGGKRHKEALRASIFMELLQSYALIHDDIIDSSELRRGGKTIHKIYEQIHLYNYEHNDPKLFGTSMAINLGDICNHLAFAHLASLKFPADRLLLAMQHAQDLAGKVFHGQLLDILSESLDLGEVDEKYVLQVHHLKTAVYTFQLPMYIGAILAGASDKDLKTIDKYAVPAGVAFQIQDDILGMFGTEEKIGKPVDSDIKEGKKTLLILKALNNGNDNDRSTILRALGNKNIQPKTIEDVRKIITETGSLDYSNALALDLIEDAIKALQLKKSLMEKHTNFFIDLANYIVKRDV